MNIHLEINGRRIRVHQFGSALERAMVQEIEASLKRKIGRIRDPLTGAAPVITIRGNSLSDLKVDVLGSDELLGRVKRQLNRR